MQFRAVRRFGVCVLVLFGLGAFPVWAQADNTCEAGETPDVIVGDLHEVRRWGMSNRITAFSVGTVSCNVGKCWLKWFEYTREHPVIAQNLYRLKDGRFEQIGQSWLKHGFFATSDRLCSSACVPTDGSHLGVNCSDPYSAVLNGLQADLGPRSDVDPTTGEFPYPYSTQGQTGNVLYKRLQVHNDDLDPALNRGARYVVEGHYVAADDAAAGNQNNNASYRHAFVTGSNGVFNLALFSQTKRQSPAILAWAELDSGVQTAVLDVEIRPPRPRGFHTDGRFIVAVKTTALPDGTWHYEYAIQNLNARRGAREFRIPVPDGALVANIGFHDVGYHSGEPFDGTDWIGLHDEAADAVVWRTDTWQDDPFANALRWGTLYNFRFDTDAAPVLTDVTLGLFGEPELPGQPAHVTAAILGPNPCNAEGACSSPGP
jgi:hypothetical protein